MPVLFSFSVFSSFSSLSVDRALEQVEVTDIGNPASYLDLVAVTFFSAEVPLTELFFIRIRALGERRG